MANALVVDNYAFIPNIPSYARVAAPDHKNSEGWTQEQIKEVLPPVNTARKYIDFLKGFESSLQYQVC